jgi:hypothetical protein
VTGPCNCRHCKPPTQAVADEQDVAELIELPDEPTPIRVHTPGLRPFDCTLHPDGTLTAVLGGEVRRNFFTFDDMRERNWAGAHFEFNPPPLSEEPEPEPAGGVVQDALL